MRRTLALALAVHVWAAGATAQTFSERGFIEGGGLLFPQTTAFDNVRSTGDLLVREELFFKPASWIQFGGGVDARANSHDQVDRRWRLDWRDRGILRPTLSLRRLTATITAPHFTVDVGKQFIRWGRADVTYPTDRFAPRDYVNVLDPELLAVTGVRPSVQIGSETFEAVWLPQLTPSRLPLLDQRWTFIPPAAAGLTIIDEGSHIRSVSQYGARWRHTGGHLETALSYFDGQNHLPDVYSTVTAEGTALEIRRVYPTIRMYGADAAIPTDVLTLKLEAAYVKAPAHDTDEYLLYVMEAERQSGEWLLDLGYAGDVVTRRSQSSGQPFAPDRGLARALIGRAAYTIDPRQTLTFEGAVRQNGDGVYFRGDYSSALGRYFRITMYGVAIDGANTDFLGQYRRNSHAAVTLRFSF
jgi:hypothetical protein